MSSGKMMNVTYEKTDEFNNFLEHLNQLHLLVVKLAKVSVLAESYDYSKEETLFFVNKE